MDVELLAFQLALKEGFRSVPRELLEDELVDKLTILVGIIEVFEKAGFKLVREPTPSG